MFNTQHSDNDEEDLHLCIRCRLSFIGLENYIEHRKKVCPKINPKQSKPTTNAGVPVTSRSSLVIEDGNDFHRSKSQPLQDFQMVDSQGHEFEKTSLQADLLESFMCEKPLVNKSESGPFPFQKPEGPANSSYSFQESRNGTSSKYLKNSTAKDFVPTSGTSGEEFSRLYDPIFNNDASVTSLFKSFDNLAENNKLSDSHLLFPPKDSSGNYYLETSTFDQRYVDLYDPLSHDQTVVASNSALLPKSKARDFSLSTLPRDTPSTSQGKHLSEQSNDHEPAPPLQKIQEDIKQDDFLSSLELSSVKVLNEKRKFAFDDDFEEEEDEDDQRPPRHHTGGKWKPGMGPPSTVGGKWRPFSPNNSEDIIETEEENEVTISNLTRISTQKPRKPKIFTKGKWLPGKEPEKSVVSYRCDPCDSEFKTHSTYKKHLKSNVHANFNPGMDLVSNLPFERPTRTTKLQAKSFLKTTIAKLNRKKAIPIEPVKRRAVKKVDSRKSAVPPQQAAEISLLNDDQDLPDSNIVLKTKSVKMKCPVCKLSFSKAYLARHFASLAHIHNELELRKSNRTEVLEEQNHIILDYIETIIPTSLFFCKDCSFYCNSQADFSLHFDTHEEKSNSNSQTVYFCSACTDVRLLNLSEVKRHMITPAHIMHAKDKILSVQTVSIYSRIFLFCSLCSKQFRFNRQCENHRRKHHKQEDFKDSTNGSRLCPLCNFQGKSAKQVRIHIKAIHGMMPQYICFVCGLQYETAKEAIIHRQSKEHRLKVGKPQTTLKSCKFCYEEFASTNALHYHLGIDHRSHCMPCVRCAFIPAFKSELRFHKKNCAGFAQKEYLEDGWHRCELCSFANPLLAHVLTHTLLVHGEAHDDERYLCHICQKSLKLISVRPHMLYHTREFPFTCRYCNRSFAQSLWLQKHLQIVHSTGEPGETPRFLCQYCGTFFSTSTNLNRHQETTSCKRKFPVPTKKKMNRIAQDKKLSHSKHGGNGLVCELCGKHLTSATTFKAHLKMHKKSEVLQCPSCPYESFSLPHMRRHLRLHSGVRPFKCPHCSYSANNQENLRRHMKSKKHPNKFLYECKFCEPTKTSEDSTKDSETHREDEAGSSKPERRSSSTVHFKTNFASEFRSHLSKHHEEKFENTSQMISHIRSYYDAEEDIATYQPSTFKKSRRDSSVTDESVDSPSSERCFVNSKRKEVKKSKLRKMKQSAIKRTVSLKPPYRNPATTSAEEASIEVPDEPLVEPTESNVSKKSSSLAFHKSEYNQNQTKDDFMISNDSVSDIKMVANTSELSDIQVIHAGPAFSNSSPLANLKVIPPENSIPVCARTLAQNSFKTISVVQNSPVIQASKYVPLDTTSRVWINSPLTSNQTFPESPTVYSIPFSNQILLPASNNPPLSVIGPPQVSPTSSNLSLFTPSISAAHVLLPPDYQGLFRPPSSLASEARSLTRPPMAGSSLAILRPLVARNPVQTISLPSPSRFRPPTPFHLRNPLVRPVSAPKFNMGLLEASSSDSSIGRHEHIVNFMNPTYGTDPQPQNNSPTNSVEKKQSGNKISIMCKKVKRNSKK